MTFAKFNSFMFDMLTAFGDCYCSDACFQFFRATFGGDKHDDVQLSSINIFTCFARNYLVL